MKYIIEDKKRIVQAEETGVDLEVAAEGGETLVTDIAEKPTEEIAADIAAGVKADVQAQGGDASEVDVNAEELKKYAQLVKNLSDLKLDLGATCVTDADKALQRAFQKTVTMIRDGVFGQAGGYQNVILLGLPGFGKTAVASQFCKARGLNMVEIDASTLAKETIGGIPYPKKQKDGRITQAPVASKIWDALEEPNSVLFLDEFNTGTTEIMGSLLGLINNHKLPVQIEDDEGNVKKTVKYFDNILFTIIACNPFHPILFPNNNDITKAAASRFGQIVNVGANNAQYLSVLRKLYETGVFKNPRVAPNVMAKYQGQLEIAKALLRARGFHFDGLQQLVDMTQAEQREYTIYKPLNYRSFLLALISCDGTKADFIDGLRYSGFTSNVISMIETALANYTDKKTTGNAVFNNRGNATEIPKQIQIKTHVEIEKLLNDFADSLG